MKSWPDRLKEIPLERLEEAIKWEKREVEMRQKSLRTMERILEERVAENKSGNGDQEKCPAGHFRQNSGDRKVPQ